MSGNTQGRVTVHENGDANSYALRSADNRWLVALLHNGEAGLGQQRENMRRLAACWNACEGMSTEDVEACPGGGLLHLAEFANGVVLQRDALLASTQVLLNALPSATTHPAIKAARAAMAAATEPQAVAADLAYNAMKNTGELQRLEADRALAEQIKWEAP